MNGFFTNIFQPAYIFNPDPPMDKSEMTFYLSFFGFILLLTLFLKFYFNRKIKTLELMNFYNQKYYSPFMTCTIFGFVLLFFRWQSITYLSSRLLVIIDFLLIIVFIILFNIYYFRKLPLQIEEYNKIKKYQQYIPTSKKKRRI